MIRDYYIIQVLNRHSCREDDCIGRSDELFFSKVWNLNDMSNFDDEWDDDIDDYIEEPSILFRHPMQGYTAIKKLSTDSYNLIKSQVEYFKNGNIKKCIIKGGRKVRLLSPVKTGKNVRKRTKRMVRG